jgi:hypothetical protein
MWRERLTVAGVAIESEFEWPRGGRSIYVRDPAGNSIEFAEPRIWALPQRRLQRASRVVVASHNEGKVREVAELMAPHGLDAVSAGALGLPEPEETGASFIANAVLKAEAAARGSGLPAIADDSGLSVDALDGAPGILSARWAGPDKDFSLAMRNVEELQAKGWAPRRRSSAGAFRLRPGGCLAGPRARRLRGPRRGHPGVAAARHARLRLRSDVPARRPRPDLRRDGPGRQACDLAPRPGLPPARRGGVRKRLSICYVRRHE